MIGFIGCGNMAQAILKGTVEAGVISTNEIWAYDVDPQKLNDIREYGVHLASGAEEMIDACGVLILAVKPNVVSGLLSQHREHLRGKALVSIAAGWSAEALKALLDPSTELLRVMPNTPALVNAGMTAFSKAHTLSEDNALLAERVFGSIGRVHWVEEYQMDAVIGVSGSGPAYVYMFIEAMADGGVLKGLPRALSMEMAAQTVLGAAEMVLKSGLHPGALKDMVCSPGGTTIEAVKSLEIDGLRAAVIHAVERSADKSKALI